jgi:hypothetical protein
MTQYQKDPQISDYLDPVAKEQLEKIAATLWRNGFRMSVTRRLSYKPACLTCGKPCTRRMNKYCTHACWARSRVGHEKAPGGGRPPLDDKICVGCKQKFHPENYRRIYCSRDCYHAHRPERKKK